MPIPGAPSVEARFADAKERYESVIAAKGSWFDHWSNPSAYGDESTQESLLVARVLLQGIAQELRAMPQPREWLLHIAGVHWQTGLIDLLNRDFDSAAAESSIMRELIPQIPTHLWGRGQRQQYESNAAFLDGEIALGRGDQEAAISHFGRSLEIDVSTGDASGAARCRRYLKALAAAPDHGASSDSAPRTSREFVLGKLAFLVVAFGTLWGLGKLNGIDVWHPAGLPGAALLGVSIVAGVVADRIVRRVTAA